MGNGLLSPNKSIEFCDPQNVSNECLNLSYGLCDICQEQTPLMKLPNCRHIFCKECINKLNNRCAVCRCQISNKPTKEQYDKRIIVNLEEIGLLL